jgi:sulfatase-like protein
MTRPNPATSSDASLDGPTPPPSSRAPADPAPSEGEAPDEPAGRAGAHLWLREEAKLALEVLALAAFAFARPTLDSFGHSPPNLVVRGVTGWRVVAFALIVTLVPGLVAAAAGLGVRALAGRGRDLVQPVVVGVVAGAAIWRVGRDLTGWPAGATKLQVVAAVAVGATALARWRLPIAASFLRFTGITCLIYVVDFLALSPASGLLTVQPAEPDAELVAAVAAQLGDDPPDVLVVTFDALPLVSLLDGTGHIDGELYPNFAALAGDGTWYRNTTTVAGFTQDAVPALLTGRYPAASEAALWRPPESESLFTLLGGNYDVQAHEQITALCPEAVCPSVVRPELGALLGDAVDHWRGDDGGQGSGSGFVLPPLAPGWDDAQQWIDGVDLGAGDQPDLVFHHVMLPHEPLEFTEDGTRYESATWLTGHRLDGWSASGAAVGLQRHLLQVQAADRVLGRYLDVLREAGTYDDTLVVVTADHGKSFTPGDASRGLSAGNDAQIMWTPFIVKAPGQGEGRIDDSDVRSVDVLPTIADLLGVELPWDVDGRPAGVGAPRDDATKPITDHPLHEVHPESGERFIEVDARAGFAEVLATDQVEGTGPHAVWRRTAHGDLVDRQVDGLTVGAPDGGSVAVRSLDDLAAVDTGEPLPLEVVGDTDLPVGMIVAYALDGTVGAVTEVEPGLAESTTLAHGLIPPWLFADGANDLTAYVVAGPPGGEVLHPLAVEAG